MPLNMRRPIEFGYKLVWRARPMRAHFRPNSLRLTERKNILIEISKTFQYLVFKNFDT